MASTITLYEAYSEIKPVVQGNASVRWDPMANFVYSAFARVKSPAGTRHESPRESLRMANIGGIPLPRTF